jgi:hypothetical protein
MAYVPISQELHGSKNWTRHPSMLFAKEDTVAPLFVTELASAVQTLPIAFVKHDENFVLVVMMGLRAGENLLVSAQGEWLSKEYMPSMYRSSPFNLLLDGDHSVLAIDERCLSDSSEGAPIFDDQGGITDGMREVFERVQNINSGRLVTSHICKILDEHDLIKPWIITLNDGSNETLKIDGLYRIDEDIFNSLSDEEFLVLRQQNAIPLVYAQLFSMQKISYLAKLAEHRPKISSNVTSNDTFSFAGL